MSKDYKMNQTEKEMHIRFCERLLKLRKAKGVTQSELGAATRISRGTILLIENDKAIVNYIYVLRLCEYYELPIDDVLFMDDKTFEQVLLET